LFTYSLAGDYCSDEYYNYPARFALIYSQHLKRLSKLLTVVIS